MDVVLQKMSIVIFWVGVVMTKVFFMMLLNEVLYVILFDNLLSRWLVLAMISSIMSTLSK